MIICNAIHARARQTPLKKALVEGDRVTTYRELSLRMRKAAAVLVNMGVAAGDPVGIDLAEGTDHVVAKLAVLEAGGVALTLDWRSRGASARILDSFDRPLLVLSDAVRDLGRNGRVAALDDSWWRVVAGHDPAPAARGDGDEPALAMLSSGSTGEPKIMVSTHGQHLWRYTLMNLFMGVGGDDVYLSALPLNFAAGNNNLVNHLMAGATVTMMPVVYSTSELIEAVERNAVTTLFVVPLQLERLIEEVRGGGMLLPGLRRLIAGGAMVSPRIKTECIDRVCPHLFVTYSSSGTGWMALAYPEDARTHPGSVGRCLPTAELQIVDECHLPVARGDSGRIRCRSNTVVARACPGFPARADDDYRDGFCYPGDLGHLDDEGYLYLDGRTSNVIIRGGVNISPETVERVLTDHPQVNEAAVCGVPSREGGEEVVALIVARGGAPIDGLAGHCRRGLGAHRVPGKLLFVDALPKTHTGKIARPELPALARALMGR